MANPVLSQPDAFTRNGSYQGYQQGPYGQPYGQPMPNAPQPNGYAQPGGGMTASGVMTLDDVIAKTAITLLLVVVSAAATWMLLPADVFAYPIAIVAALVGFVTALFVSRARNIPVGGVLFYAVVEGVFVGVISRMFELRFPGIVGTAVFATFVAAAAILFAYKFFNIRVTPKFQKIVIMSTAAFAGLMLVNLVLVLFNVNTGLVMVGSAAGPLAWGVSALAIVLAVFNLVMDFDYVEKGIAQGAPARESWRAAFGLTVTMVWLYLEILRVLSYFRN